SGRCPPRPVSRPETGCPDMGPPAREPLAMATESDPSRGWLTALLRRRRPLGGSLLAYVILLVVGTAVHVAHHGTGVGSASACPRGVARGRPPRARGGGPPVPPAPRRPAAGGAAPGPGRPAGPAAGPRTRPRPAPPPPHARRLTSIGRGALGRGSVRLGHRPR